MKRSLLIAVALVGFCWISQGSGHALTFGVCGDSRHDGKGRELSERVFGEIFSLAKEHGCKFLIHTGDFILDDSPEEWAHLEGFFERIGLSKAFLRPAVGNHDLDQPGRRTATRFCRFFGLDSPNYSFTEQGIHFTVFDNCTPAPDQAWLDRALSQAGDALKVLVCHKPLAYAPFSNRTPDNDYPSNEVHARILQSIRRAAVRLVFAGHEHHLWHAALPSAHQLTTGGAGAPLRFPAHRGGFYHLVIVDIDEGKIRTWVIPIAEPVPLFEESL
jgi:hypothetical protein